MNCVGITCPWDIKVGRSFLILGVGWSFFPFLFNFLYKIHELYTQIQRPPKMTGINIAMIMISHDKPQFSVYACEEDNFKAIFLLFSFNFFFFFFGEKSRDGAKL